MQAGQIAYMSCFLRTAAYGGTMGLWVAPMKPLSTMLVGGRGEAHSNAMLGRAFTAKAGECVILDRTSWQPLDLGSDVLSVGFQA